MKRIIFYILSFTWGFIMSFIGLIGIIFCGAFGTVKRFHGRLYGVVGHNWGGVCLGCFFFVCHESAESNHTRAHESGHGLQNCIWGPLFPFVIALPSSIRYWYRNYRSAKGNPCKTAYDDIWFEGQATQWGKKYVLTDII